MCVWVMMNKLTRRLSKIPAEVREEIGSILVNFSPILEEDSRKLSKLHDKTTDYVRSGLSPRWNDLDVNQHVNNVKYIDWILDVVFCSCILINLIPPITWIIKSITPTIMSCIKKSWTYE